MGGPVQIRSASSTGIDRVEYVVAMTRCYLHCSSFQITWKKIIWMNRKYIDRLRRLRQVMTALCVSYEANKTDILALSSTHQHLTHARLHLTPPKREGSPPTTISNLHNMLKHDTEPVGNKTEVVYVANNPAA